MNATTKHKELWLVRHAQSEWNRSSFKEKMTFAIPDCGLSAVGVQEASDMRIVDESGEDIVMDLLILSPMRRAVQTYACSGLRSRTLVMHNAFREYIINPSDCLPEEKFSTVHETYGMLQKRVLEAERYILQRPESKIAVLTHHDFLVAFTQHAMKRGLSLANAQVVHVPQFPCSS